MDNMLDYIFVDYLYYIFPYSFFISIGVFCACVIYMAVYGNNKFVTRFSYFFDCDFFVWYYLSQLSNTMGGGPHYDCNSRIEREAQNIASAIAKLFFRTKQDTNPEL